MGHHDQLLKQASSGHPTEVQGIAFSERGGVSFIVLTAYEGPPDSPNGHLGISDEINQCPGNSTSYL